MSRMATMSPLGLYRWDNTIFDLMQIPSALDKPTLIDNLLSETAELEVLYPNPVVFKNLVGVWSAKQIDIWNRLYATTQYEYNPIENYNRYETGSEDGSGRTTHSGTDTTADTTTYGGTDGRTEAIMQGGSDTNTRQMAEGGTEGESTTSQMAQGGQDVVTGSDTKGHWIAGFDSTASGQNDGLVKQTRDQDDANTTTAYGKTESDNGSKTTTFGKTESGSDATAYGKTESETGSKTTNFGKTESGSDATAYGKTESETGNKTTNFGKTESGSDATAYGKTESETGNKTTNFGKTESESDTTAYGKTENVTETRTYGQTIQKAGNITHGEQIDTTNEGSHELHAHGNIGVTTTQKLIREQRDIELFNLYDIIIEDFKMRFCILIY